MKTYAQQLMIQSVRADVRRFLQALEDGDQRSARWHAGMAAGTVERFRASLPRAAVAPEQRARLVAALDNLPA